MGLQFRFTLLLVSLLLSPVWASTFIGSVPCSRPPGVLEVRRQGEDILITIRRGEVRGRATLGPAAWDEWLTLIGDARQRAKTMKANDERRVGQVEGIVVSVVKRPGQRAAVLLELEEAYLILQSPAQFNTLDDVVDRASSGS